MNLLASWWVTNAPALPAAAMMQLGMQLGWALLLALLGASWGATLARRRLQAAVLALWTLAPGPLAPDFWLGLAFHAPSLSTMLLCAGLLWQRVGQPRPAADAWPTLAQGWLWWPVALGWLLLLDTFAVWPLQVYAWGFSRGLLLVLLAVALLPWLLPRASPVHRPWVAWVAPLALLLFAATHLPTGNLWDALLDPVLWIALQVLLLVRGLRARRASRRAATTTRG